jgi:hypothetical protein
MVTWAELLRLKEQLQAEADAILEGDDEDMFSNTQNGLPMCDNHGEFCPQDCPERRAYEVGIAAVGALSSVRDLVNAVVKDFDAKAKEVNPHLNACRKLYKYLDDRNQWPACLPGASDSLKKVIEFIECLDEPGQWSEK